MAVLLPIPGHIVETGIATPFSAIPPTTMGGFNVGLIGFDTKAGSVGYDPAVSLLNANAFNFDKTFLTMTNKVIFSITVKV